MKVQNSKFKVQNFSSKFKIFAFCIGLLIFAFCILILEFKKNAFAFSSPNFVIDDVSFGDSPILTAGVEAPPKITAGPNVLQKGLTAEISWATDKSSNSIIAFGVDDKYGTETGLFEESVTDHRVILKGLDPITTYHYQARSRDGFGNTARSDDLSFTTGQKPAISTVVISEITLNSAIVSWTTSTITTSIVKYGKTLDYDKEVEDKSSGLTTVHTALLKNLETGTKYHLQVQGMDDAGNTMLSDDYAFSTLPNPAVLNLTVSDITESKASFSWETNTEADSFIEYGELGKEKKTQGQAETFLRHKVQVEGLSAQTIYEYRVVGKDKNGNAVASAIGQFTTLPDVTPSEISRIRTETKVSNEGEGNNAQIIISWDTSEPSTSQVEYAEGVGKPNFDMQTELDNEMAVNHIVVLNKLKTAAAYTFRVKSKDAAGNEGVSQKFVVLMPQRQQGVLEIIFGALIESFSWFRNVGPYLFEVAAFRT
ncbi:MAG: fibronectin type III domain-containing protein [Patescibacteria group bacterium]